MISLLKMHYLYAFVSPLIVLTLSFAGFFHARIFLDAALFFTFFWLFSLSHYFAIFCMSCNYKYSKFHSFDKLNVSSGNIFVALRDALNEFSKCKVCGANISYYFNFKLYSAIFLFNIFVPLLIIVLSKLMKIDIYNTEDYRLFIIFGINIVLLLLNSFFLRKAFFNRNAGELK